MATASALASKMLPHISSTSAVTSTATSTASIRYTMVADQQLLENHDLWASLPALTLKGRNRGTRIARALRLPPGNARRNFVIPSAVAGGSSSETVETKTPKFIHGKCFVVGDNIDTDQIIPAEYLTLVPSKPEEYEKLGGYAMIGLPAHYGQFVEPGKAKTDYAVMVAGANFGCGSSREHAPVALGAAGVRVVIAESYARIFFRNSVSTGELYPLESQDRICEENKTGDYVTVDLEKDVLINHTSGKQFPLLPIGDAGPVIDAGGIFNYARATGMIASPGS